MEEARRLRISKGMWIALGIVAVLFWGLTHPIVISSGRNSDQTDAVSNARQIGLALFEFETEYGSFPDETTAAKIRQKTGTLFNLGSASSNDYFRQLIAAEMVTSEAIFYAKTNFSKKPDNKIDPGGKALAPGEVGYGYLMNGKSAFNTKGNPARPLVCTPLAFDGKTVNDQTFDRSMYDGKAVVLRIDNSVVSLPISVQTNLAIRGKGKTLLETGPDTVWGDSAKPVIIPPRPKP